MVFYGSTTDNNQSVKLEEIFGENYPQDILNELYRISGKKIGDLKNKDGFLVFCNEDKLKDDVETSSIFTISDDKLTTYNIAGFIGTKNSLLSIRSRFAKNNETDFFLHYMLHKVLNINLSSLEHTTAKNNVFHFLPYLFKYYFVKALNQGLYKKYVWNKYNDSRVKGTIDIARHIKHSFAFTGNIAYNIREHSYDNNINQLIRHTIEYIDNNRMFHWLLQNDDMLDFVQDIRSITPSYSIKDRQQVINKNLKSDIHPYYYEYEPLRQICLQILMEDDELKYGRKENKIYGILFDISWLWEEYLNTLIQEIDGDFKHPRNKESSGRIHMLEENGWHAYPDFYSEKLGIVMDAKYKRSQGIKDIGSDDRMQIISYMHILGLNKGVFLYPSAEKNYIQHRRLNLNKRPEIDECVFQYMFKIPQGDNINNMEHFIKYISKSEKIFIKYWQKFIMNVRNVNN